MVQSISAQGRIRQPLPGTSKESKQNSEAPRGCSWGLGFTVEGLGFTVEGLGFRVSGKGFLGSRLRVEG